ncbi:MAG: hypothetical protein SO029_07745, partial [Sodaliphilus sp.]|nr:hypothetical protein [Sodaliphilus sp.]
CGASFACMELTIISRFQRLQASTKSLLHSLYFSELSILRQITDIQYGITIMGGREVSRPYRIVFFAKRLFFMFFVSVPPLFIH